MSELYYKAPEEKIFNELKEAAISLWKEFDDTYGYSTEKINRIKYLQNIRDNFMHIVSMFDMGNQRKLSLLINADVSKAIRERMIDGGSEEQYIVF